MDRRNLASHAQGGTERREHVMEIAIAITGHGMMMVVGLIAGAWIIGLLLRRR